MALPESNDPAERGARPGRRVADARREGGRYAVTGTVFSMGTLMREPHSVHEPS